MLLCDTMRYVCTHSCVNELLDHPLRIVMVDRNNLLVRELMSNQ